LTSPYETKRENVPPEVSTMNSSQQSSILLV